MDIKNYYIDGSPKDLLKEDWDILVILDACRYDLFEETYHKIIHGGKLSKAVSPASRTLEWCSRIFTDYYEDIVYVSGNPFINSRSAAGMLLCTFDAKKHFYKIVDAWDDGWDKELRCTPPEEINNAFFSALKKYPKKRFILHYIQPHTPYIGSQKRDGPVERKFVNTRQKRYAVPPFLKGAKKLLLNVTQAAFGPGVIWRVVNFITGTPATVVSSKLERRIWRYTHKLFGFPPSPNAATYMNLGWGGIREAYKANLERVLGSVSELIEYTDRKILITADHGEFLGEYGLFTHPIRIRKPENTEVPWLEIQGKGKMKGAITKSKKPLREETKTTKKDEEVIRKRLEALGYM